MSILDFLIKVCTGASVTHAHIYTAVLIKAFRLFPLLFVCRLRVIVEKTESTSFRVGGLDQVGLIDGNAIIIIITRKDGPPQMKKVAFLSVAHTFTIYVIHSDFPILKNHINCYWRH